MEITVTQETGRLPVTVFHISGEINSSTYEEFGKRAREAYEAGTRNLLLDLKDVTYVSSAGIRALNDIMKMLRTDAPEESDAAMSKGVRDGTFHSPHLKLVNVPNRVVEVLKMAGVDMLLEIHKTMKEALASY